MNDYSHDYRTLGVEPGCDIETLRAARRRLVKTWHPDRFPDDSDSKREAEERIKSINISFDRLSGYHRDCGDLPGFRPDLVEQTSSTIVPESPKEPRAEPMRDTAKHARGRSTTVIRMATALLAFTLIGILMWDAMQKDLALNEPTATNHIAAEPPRPSDNTFAKTNSSIRYFTVGSTMGEVYAVQGVPSATKESVWHYGKSRIYFVGGVVSSWDHDPENPLMADISSRSTKPRTDYFRIGSSKAEVRAIQGPPLIESGDVWDYGLSKVYFHGDHVTKWDSSPMHPLRARK